MLNETQLKVIQRKLMECTQDTPLDGDELEQLANYLAIANGDISYKCFNVCKDDLRLGNGNKKLVDSLTHEEMLLIANKYRDVICLNNDWDYELIEVMKEVIKLRSRI